MSYRAVLRPTRPGSVPPKEHSLDPRTTETEFFGLDPETEYEAQVVAVYTAGESKELMGIHSTLEGKEM